MYQIKIKATADDLFDSLLNFVDSKPCSLKVTAAEYKGTISQNYSNCIIFRCHSKCGYFGIFDQIGTI